MTGRSPRTTNAIATARRRLIEDLNRLSDDAGVSRRALARSSGVGVGFLSRILAGTTRPSIETYVRLATPLGADFVARIYPNTGPLIRDRHQARMLEFLLGQIHPRWETMSEVTVHRPARGTIDLVLIERRGAAVVAVELQSELRRLEQLVRWSQEKADSLPSSRMWPGGLDPRTTSLLIVVRRTRATRRVATEFRRQLEVAFPAHPDDAVAALTGTRAWPGSALVWVVIEGQSVRFVSGR